MAYSLFPEMGPREGVGPLWGADSQLPQGFWGDHWGSDGGQGSAHSQGQPPQCPVTLTMDGGGKFNFS